MSAYTNHFSKTKQQRALEDKHWSTSAISQREYDSSVAHYMITECAKKEVNGLTAEQWIVKLRQQHEHGVKLVKDPFHY